MILFGTFDELSEVLFLCHNLSMKDILNNILNPYTSISEKDILWDILGMEERDAELSKYARILAVSAACDAAAVPGQIGTVAEPIPEHYTGTVDELLAQFYAAEQSRNSVGTGRGWR